MSLPSCSIQCGIESWWRRCFITIRSRSTLTIHDICFITFVQTFNRIITSFHNPEFSKRWRTERHTHLGGKERATKRDRLLFIAYLMHPTMRIPPRNPSLDFQRISNLGSRLKINDSFIHLEAIHKSSSSFLTKAVRGEDFM